MNVDPHPATADLAYVDAVELLERLQAGSLTSVELVTALLERIAAIDAPESDIGLRSILALADDALIIAEQRDAQRATSDIVGPLHGLPIVIKDNLEAVGLPCTAGSFALANSVVAADAPVIRQLRDAGAIVIAATNLSEWANIRSGASTSGWSAVGGLTGNPWALDRSPGGSSAGSGAALAAGLAPLAIGTETDGSIVCPASVNGVVGLKPTVGRLSSRGIVPISHSQDTAGPMARSVRDVALLWQALTGELPADSRDITIGVVSQWRIGYAHTDAIFDAAVERLRASDMFGAVIDLELPEMEDAEHADELRVLLSELHDDLAAYLEHRRPASGVRTLADVVAFNRAHADEELRYFGQELFELALEWGGVDEEARAARARNVEWARTICLDPAFAQVDLLIAPTYAPAWKSDFTFGHPRMGGSVTSPAAVAGYPLLSLPMGAVQGLPVGLAIVGSAASEPVMLGAAAEIERTLGVGGPDWRPGWRRPERG